MTPKDIAVFLALASALCVAVGDVLQQRAAHCAEHRSLGHVGLLGVLVRNPRWWCGAALLVASIALQAAALSRGSVLLVQALLMLSLLFALPVNAWVSHRVVHRGEWIWGGLLTAAVSVVVTVGHPAAGHCGAPLRSWIAVTVVLGSLLTACAVAGRRLGGAAAAALFAFVAGSLWGVFAVLTKEVVARLGVGAAAVVRTPELYAAALVVAGGFVWGQAAFRAGPLTASMPTLQMAQPVVGAVLGVVVLDETLTTGRAGAAALAVAALVMAAAIVKLARVEAVATHAEIEERLDDEVGQPA
ncbi:hypothetical protein A5714_04560 [Mycobacterium sp. E2462]|uniref:DMT family transporter n=1 Tax=Mycobacterium sp. E2462 TaxID=1834133 RepID=UPI0007FE06AB|nr:DMT family transporter [Mycobacterium sp. E2462]OBI03160.1 hypothetical protein A5714_04560 [Mycobacterium sp. E2462]